MNLDRYGVIRAVVWSAIALPLLLVMTLVVFVVFAFVVAAVGANP